MELLKLEKIKDGRYLKNYELTYRNKAGKEKKYEIVSRSEIAGPEAIGKRVSGVSIVAYHEDKMLLLREFRMGVNRFVYNLCAGMLEEGESLEECVSSGNSMRRPDYPWGRSGPFCRRPLQQWLSPT